MVEPVVTRAVATDRVKGFCHLQIADDMAVNQQLAVDESKGGVSRPFTQRLLVLVRSLYRYPKSPAVLLP